MKSSASSGTIGTIGSGEKDLRYESRYSGVVVPECELETKSIPERLFILIREATASL